MSLTSTLCDRAADCVELFYRTPASSVAHLLPEGLELVLRGRWAFWSITVCPIEKLPPDSLPPALDVLEKPSESAVYQVAYRLLVQAMTHRADVRRGLYLVRGDVDDGGLTMARERVSGPRREHPAEIRLAVQHGEVALDVKSHDGVSDVRARMLMSSSRLADGSCFPTLMDAREFLDHKPYLFTVAGNANHRSLQIAEREPSGLSRQQASIAVDSAAFNLFAQLEQTEVELERATWSQSMTCRWRVSQTEKLLEQASTPSPAVALPGVA
ncbi:MAG: hypothetical protein AAGG38_01825 [Planctomycetota bacterium]